jgi:hypothetical protein
LAQLAPKTRYAALPGAGVFLDTRSYSGLNFIEPIFRWLHATANMSLTGNARCAEALREESWRCLTAQAVIPFVQTPLFVANSLADLASQGFTMGLPCNPAYAPGKGGCSAPELAYLDAYSELMISVLKPVLTPGSRHGAWLVTCSVHMLENVDGAVSRISVRGSTLSDVFSNWWTNATASHTAVDQLWTQGPGENGGNADCPLYGPLPSRP